MLAPSLNKPTLDAVIEPLGNEVFKPQPVYSCISKLWSGISDAKAPEM